MLAIWSLDVLKRIANFSATFSTLLAKCSTNSGKLETKGKIDWMAKQVEVIWKLLCREILISLFLLIIWHEDRACRAKNCFVFPKLSSQTFVHQWKLEEILLFVSAKWREVQVRIFPRTFARMFDEISKEQLTKFSDFRLHHFCAMRYMYLYQK